MGTESGKTDDDKVSLQHSLGIGLTGFQVWG